MLNGVMLNCIPYLMLAIIGVLMHKATSQRSGSMTTTLASVGGKQTLDCVLHYPDDTPNHHFVLFWRKAGFSDPILIKYYGYPAQVNYEEFRNRLELVNGISLQISAITIEDEGWYECDPTFISAQQADISGNDSWVYLTVNSPPKILSSSHSLLNHRRGETIRLHCMGYGSPKPSLQWRRDGQRLFSGGRFYVNNTEVVISRLQREDSGLYSCVFSNRVGEISQLIKLVVEGRPYIRKRPRNVTAVEGQRVELTCEAEAFPDNITYAWSRGRRGSNPLLQHDHRVSSRGGKLLIVEVTRSDADWYTCRCSNGLGVVEASAFLNVTYFPHVLDDKMPSHVSWPEGFRQKLDCPVQANPPVTGILWVKGQNKVRISDRLRVVENGSLVVTEVTKDDAGSYFCIPTSALGQGPSSSTVQVSVRKPPVFTIRPAKHYQQLAGKTIQISCAATGTPMPSIEWTKLQRDGEIYNRNIGIQTTGGHLIITDLQKTDHGTYQCMASSDVANVRSDTLLTVVGTTPYSPERVTTVMGLFNVVIRWKPGYDGGYKQRFFLWYHVTEDSWHRLAIPDNSRHNFAVYRLKPNSQYEFKIVAANKLGNGSFSNVVMSRTLGYRPNLVTYLPVDSTGETYLPDVLTCIGPIPTPPSNLTATVHGDWSVMLVWHSCVDPPVPVFWYRVQHRMVGGGRWLLYSKPILHSSGTRVHVDDLDAGTYQLRVLAYGVLAFSQPSNSVAVTIERVSQAKNGVSNMETSTANDNVIPDILIGGVVGGVMFLLIASLLVAIAVIHKHRKQEKSRRMPHGYSTVVYSKPDDNTGHRQQTISKRQCTTT